MHGRNRHVFAAAGAGPRPASDCTLGAGQERTSTAWCTTAWPRPGTCLDAANNDACIFGGHSAAHPALRHADHPVEEDGCRQGGIAEGGRSRQANPLVQAGHWVACRKTAQQGSRGMRAWHSRLLPLSGGGLT